MKIALPKDGNGLPILCVEYLVILAGMQDTAVLLKEYDEGALLKVLSIYKVVYEEHKEALPRLVDKMAGVMEEVAALKAVEAEKGKEN